MNEMSDGLRIMLGGAAVLGGLSAAATLLYLALVVVGGRLRASASEVRALEVSASLDYED